LRRCAAVSAYCKGCSRVVGGEDAAMRLVNKELKAVRAERGLRAA
jgi:hypothetical protein